MTKSIRRSHHPIGVRIQALALVTHGVDIRLVEQVTGMPRQTIQFWVRKARERGYNPYVDSRIRIEYVEDGKRSGRPRATGPPTGLSVLELVEKNRAEREMDTQIKGNECGTSGLVQSPSRLDP